MGFSQKESKLAVEAGYWHLYRYDPRRVKEGLNPFVLDSKAPTRPLREFLMGEVRYSALERTFPKEAKVLITIAEEDAKEKYERYRQMAAAKRSAASPPADPLEFPPLAALSGAESEKVPPTSRWRDLLSSLRDSRPSSGRKACRSPS